MTSIAPAAPWRLVKAYASWDESDAQRAAWKRDHPRLDVRLRYDTGRWRLEVRKGAR